MRRSASMSSLLTSVGWIRQCWALTLGALASVFSPEPDDEAQSVQRQSNVKSKAPPDTGLRDADIPVAIHSHLHSQLRDRCAALRGNETKIRSPVSSLIQ